MNIKAPKAPKNTKLTKTNNKTTKTTKNTILPKNKLLPIKLANCNRIIPYNDEIAQKIIIDISSQPNISIKQIAKNNGINLYSLHYWKVLYDKFASAYYTAKENRQDIEVESIQEQIEELLKWLSDNEELDPREKHVHIQALRLKMQNTQWTASKLSHRYRDTPGIQINIDAGGRRAAAWDKWQEVRAKK